MNSLQLHKLNLMSTNKDYNEESRRLIRQLLEERNELFAAIIAIQDKSYSAGLRGKEWRV